MTNDEIVAVIAGVLTLVYVLAKWEHRHGAARGARSASRPLLVGGELDFPARLVHVTGENPDGTSRQAAVAACQPGELLRVASNPFDPGEPAPTAVLASTGQLIGYLPRHIAERVAELEVDGCPVSAFVLEVTGGADGSTIGLTARMAVVERKTNGARWARLSQRLRNWRRMRDTRSGIPHDG